MSNKIKLVEYTPGPWSYRTAQKAVGDESLDAGIFAEIEGANRVIAECFGRVGQNLYIDSSANARLIAAAPKLLEALQQIFQHCALVHSQWGEESNQREADAAIAFAKDTIAKALGK